MLANAMLAFVPYPMLQLVPRPYVIAHTECVAASRAANGKSNFAMIIAAVVRIIGEQRF